MATKTSVCKKVYVLKDGREVRSPASADHNAADIDRLEFRFAAGTTRIVKLSDFMPEEAVAQFIATFTKFDQLLASLWHGKGQKLGDAYSGSTKKEADPVELFDAVYENLVDGMWVESGSGGGEAAPSLLVDAVVAAMTTQGLPPDPEKIKAKLTPRDADGKLDKPAAKKARDGALANPAVKAEYEKAKADRAAKRAKEAAAAAKTAGKEAAADLDAFV